MAERLRYVHLSAIDFQDFVEIIFGIFFGVMVFLGASELWNIGAILNDVLVVGIVIINFVLLYLLTKFISNIYKSRGIFFVESVRYPIERSAIVYIVGFFVSLLIIFWMKQMGVLNSFIKLSVAGFLPDYLRIAVFANLFATLFAITIDLLIVDRTIT
ncbi:MAG: hypothetical protein QXD72_02195 [Candidatus Aenigmatarchaeota archaeon]